MDESNIIIIIIIDSLFFLFTKKHSYALVLMLPTNENNKINEVILSEDVNDVQYKRKNR